jgi:hypothetical protein
MAARKDQTDSPPARRQRGFEPASQLLAQRIRVVGESRGFAVSRLLTGWAEIAGPDLAPITRPVKVSYGREGGLGANLTLLVAPAHAPMVQMTLPQLRDRVNAAYGYAAISRITLTQTAATGFAEGQAQFSPAPPSAPPRPDPALVAQAAGVAAPIRDQGLRSALEALAQNILTRQKSKEGPKT